MKTVTRAYDSSSSNPLEPVVRKVSNATNYYYAYMVYFTYIVYFP